MRPNEQNIPERRDPHRSGRFELFFYEQVGSRYYLRFTRLALLLIVCMTVVPIVLLFALFLSRQRGGPKNVNIDIVAPTPAPHDYGKPIIQPQTIPPLTPPKVSKQPGAGAPTQQVSPVPAGNKNGLPTPSPTSSPTPARTPT